MNSHGEVARVNPWASAKLLFTSIALFLVSVFCMYVSVESDKFYRADVITLEFLAAILSGVAVTFIVSQFIFSEPGSLLNENGIEAGEDRAARQD